ncbi:restriction endonuclease subunit S [Campylobacter hyointestinalis]|uniref:restriction endonuclease subunit S n=1 Tax=Campylobacter hyointestinalis TaxID=198 RepID=UPI001597556B|nr:restriction endonuclease subunit S [Campylobacter hyointestinalis]QKF70194.1 type IIB restriction/modification system, specificity subunit [Campylobacter hyointestinalis subsp. lawsonii]
MFEKLNLGFKKSKFEKDKDVSKIKNIEFQIPLVNAKDGDNGIMYYGKKQDFDTATMTIDIVNDGAVSTGNVYPQPQETGVLYNAYLIKSKFDISKNLLFFFATTIQKSIKLKFSYELKASWERVKNENIKLPITQNGEIDFDFMESFIAELEAERVRELESYLKASDLSDTTLSSDEYNALNTLNSKTWSEFELGKLFTFKGIKQSKSQKEIPTDQNGIPYIVQSTTNNMCSRYVNKQYLIDTNELPNKGNAIVLGVTLPAISYQPKEFGASQIIEARSDFLNKENGLFFVTAIYKQMYQFSYQNKPGIEIYKNLKIKLPITTTGEIDFDFMESFISGVQKTSIKGVIELKDKIIEQTKKAI